AFAFGNAATPTTTDAGGLFKKSAGAGSTSIQGAFSSNGTVNVIAGTVSLSGGDFVSSGSVTLKSGAVLEVQANGYQQTGGATTADGTLMATTATFSGGDLAGNGAINGQVLNTGAIVRPGGASSPGILTINGDYSQSPGGTLEIELTGSAPGSQY